MSKHVPVDEREISIQELVQRLKPGTKLTLLIVSTCGRESRRHRVVQGTDGDVVRLATVPRQNTEPFVEIVFGAGDRAFLQRDGFALVASNGIGSQYVWGHA
jgi:hypothetical protein